MFSGSATSGGENSVALRGGGVGVAIRIVAEFAADRGNVVIQRTRLVTLCEAAVQEGFVRDRVVEADAAGRLAPVIGAVIIDPLKEHQVRPTARQLEKDGRTREVRRLPVVAVAESGLDPKLVGDVIPGVQEAGDRIGVRVKILVKGYGDIEQHTCRIDERYDRGRIDGVVTRRSEMEDPQEPAAIFSVVGRPVDFSHPLVARPPLRGNRERFIGVILIVDAVVVEVGV